MKPLKGNPTLRLLRLVLRRFNRLELLIQNNSRPLPDDLIDTPAVRMLTRMSDRTLSRRRSDGTIPYVKHGGKKEHTCDTGGKKLIAKEFGAGLVAYKKKAEESPVV